MILEIRKPAEEFLVKKIEKLMERIRANPSAINRISDGALLARARTLYVWINIDTGRPVRIPPHFLADFTPNIAE